MQIISFLKEKFQKKSVKNFFTLFTGSVIGQTIVFLTIPFLTRLFSQEMFGVYILFTSSVMLLKTLVTLNFEFAIMLPKRDKDAINIFFFNIILIFFLSITLLIIIILFESKIASLLKIQTLSSFIYFVPISTFLVGNISAFNYWNNRNNKFQYISASEIIKSSSISLSQIGIGFSSLKYFGLIPGIILGQLISITFLLNVSIKSILKLKKHITLRRMLFLTNKYRDIPIYNTILTFTNNLSNELPIILITRFFGLASAGIFGLALKVSKAAPGIIGQSISQIFFNEASNLYNTNGDLHMLILKTYKTLLVIALFIFAPLFILSFYLDIVFGKDWVDVGVYIRIILPWLFIMFLNSPITSIISILNKQKIILLYNFLLLLFRFLALYIGYRFYNDIFISLFLFSIVGFVFNIFILIYFLYTSKHYTKQKKNVYN